MSALLDNHPDKVIIVAAILLMMLGVVFVYSSSGPFCQFLNPPKPTWYFFARQAVWGLVAIAAMFVAYRMDYKLIIKISPVLVALSLLALAAVFPLSHAEIKRWINIGGFTFQPSEFFKIAMVAFVARIAAKYVSKEMTIKQYIPALVVIGLGTLLIVEEPDLGTTTLVMTVGSIMLFLLGFPKKYILVMVSVFVVLASILVFVMGYERDRIDAYSITLRDPFSPNASYQTRQSLVSLGSGGILGKGLGNGGQKHLFLPARHTDFIISSVAEEGGFVVIIIILALFTIVCWSGYRIAKSAIDIEGSFFAWGIMLFIVLQATVNIGVAFGVFPITGITLPFLSYGGSSLFVSMVGIGMIASVARQSRAPKNYFKRFRV
jgi:cell division protein FtsW